MSRRDGLLPCVVLSCGGAARGLLLARNDEARAVIVRAAQAAPAERTAVKELAAYLRRIAGAKFQVLDEPRVGPNRPAIYVGWTAFAASHGVDFAALGEEESVLRTVGRGLILAGGRPRGTLYAVYIFLEDALGCRWYTAFAEKIPQRPTCAAPHLDRRVRPAFALRDPCTNLPSRDWSDEQKKAFLLFNVRNRLNGPSATRGLTWRFKRRWTPQPLPGGEAYGGAAFLRHGAPHMFAHHFPSERYFAAHPEWYSMRRSERTPAHVSSGNHLCLTNPELRRAYVAKLKSLMREHPGLRVFSAAMNDGGNPTPCDCPRCAEFMNASSSSDLYFDFVNELADGVRPAFPRNFLWTLAYSFARRPLKKAKVRDNVIVMACLLKSDKVTLLETEGGRPFRNNALEA